MNCHAGERGHAFNDCRVRKHFDRGARRAQTELAATPDVPVVAVANLLVVSEQICRYASFGATFGAQANLTRCLAIEYGKDKIRVNEVRDDELRHALEGQTVALALKAGTPIGKKAQDIMARGDLVPDDVILGIMKEALGAPAAAKGAILDMVLFTSFRVTVFRFRVMGFGSLRSGEGPTS